MCFIHYKNKKHFFCNVLPASFTNIEDHWWKKKKTKKP